MILVTGASGYIGNHLVEKLVQEGKEVTALIRPSSDATRLNMLGVKTKFGDLTDPESLRQATLHCDTVIHLAAYYTFHGKKEQYDQINVGGTKAIAEACHKNQVNHFIYCSSTEAIGPVQNPPGDEDAEPNPQYEYGRSKLAAEKAVKEYGDRGLKYTIIRPSGVYGPGNIDDVSYWFIMALARGGLASKFIVGSGTNLIQFVHIDDVVQGIILALDKPSISMGKTYNISSDKAHTYEEVYSIMAKTLGVKPPGIHAPPWLAKIAAFNIETLNRLVGRQDFMWHTSTIDAVTSNRAYSIRKAVRELGYNPKYSLERGIAETVEWYKERKII